MLRIRAREQIERVLVRADFQIVDGEIEDAVGVGRKMLPERWLRAAEADSLVAKLGTGGIVRGPMGETMVRLLGLSGAAKQRHLHRSGADHFGRFGQCAVDLVERRGQVAAAGFEPRQLYACRRTEGAKEQCAFPLGARLVVLSERGVGEAEVVVASPDRW